MLVLLERQQTRGLSLIRRVKWSPDGDWLAAIWFERINGQPSSRILLWNLNTSAEPIELGSVRGRMMSLEFCGGHYLAAGNPDRRVRLWDVHHQRELGCLPNRSRKSRNPWPTPDDPVIRGTQYAHISAGGSAERLWGYSRGCWYQWHVRSRRIEQARHLSKPHHVDSCAVTPDARHLLFTDGTVRKMGLEEGFSRARKLSGVSDGCEKVIVSRCGKRFAFIAGSQLKVGSLSAPTKSLRTLSGHRSFVYAAAFGESGHSIITGGQDGTTRIWSTDSFQEQAKYNWEVGRVTAIDVSPDGTTVAAGGDGNPALIIWDLD